MKLLFIFLLVACGAYLSFVPPNKLYIGGLSMPHVNSVNVCRNSTCSAANYTMYTHVVILLHESNWNRVVVNVDGTEMTVNK